MAGIEIYAPRLAKHRRTWTAAAIPLSVIFIIIGEFLSVALTRPFGLQITSNTPTWVETSATLFGFGLMIVVAWLWLWLFERRGLKEIGYNGQWLRRYGLGLALGCAFIASVVGIIALLGGYSIQGAGVWAAPSVVALLPLVVLAGGFAVQGASEETLMRGWLLQLVSSRHGIIWGVVVNMLVFSLLHAGNIVPPTKELLVGLANIVLVAVFLSLYALREGSLVGVCAWHSAWNWLLGVGFGLEVSGQRIAVTPLITDLADRPGAVWWLTGGAFGPEASVVTTGVLALGIAFLIWKGAYQMRGGYPVVSNTVETSVF